MARSINKIIIVGNVGNDPEIRMTTGGNRVASISLATSRRWGKGEQSQEKTEWHRVIAWNTPNGKGQQLADLAEKYIRKGTQLYIEGRVEYRSYTGQDGQTKRVTEVMAHEIMMLGGKGATADDARDRPIDRRDPPANTKPKPGEDFEDFKGGLGSLEDDDDLPF